VANPSGPNLVFTYEDTVLLTGPNLVPTSGLDADITGVEQLLLFPPLPVADYVGNGYGGSGPGGRRISVDSEGLVLNPDGSFWISDEYGPYIYHFDAFGTLITAIEPPAAYIPTRNGSTR
jgi:hypothetical protein